MTAATRPNWDDWALLLAAAAATRGDCTRKQVGAVIVDTRNRVVITGHNGAPPGGPSCLAGECPRGQHYLTTRLDSSSAAICICGRQWPCPLAAEPGSSYDSGPGTCIANHAELNCLIWADPARLPGSTIYVTCKPCAGCARAIAGSGIVRIVWGPPSDAATRALLNILLPGGVLWPGWNRR
jgi:dCMP deaminase